MAVSGLPKLADHGTLTKLVAGVTVHLQDQIVPGNASPYTRNYLIVVTATHPLPAVTVSLSTRPIIQWTAGHLFPQGPDYLPSLSHWGWTVTHGGRNDTANWTALLSASQLVRLAPWANGTYDVIGTSSIHIKVSVNPTNGDGSRASGGGVVLNARSSPGAQIPTNDPDFAKMLTALHPPILRWSQTSTAPAVWGGTPAAATFSWTNFTPLVNLSLSLRVPSYVSLPAGSWGDGNNLPSGMPLNHSLFVYGPGKHAHGYFPTAAAYATYIKDFALGIRQHGWKINYWNLGNEVPIYWNNSVAHALAPVFNAGESAIHSVFPNATVGSDVLMMPNQLQYYAQHLHNVGFLAFHYYEFAGACARQAWCPPNGIGSYLTDGQIVQTKSDISHMWYFTAPHLAQIRWHNYTGNWVPALNAESNLNTGWRNGSDVRQQALFGAAILGYNLIQSSRQNVSELIYYSFQSPNPLPPMASTPYGGWGFGSSTEGTNDSDLRYAPYWALQMWNTAMSHGSGGLATVDTNTYIAPVYAARNGTGFNLLIVNRANIALTATVYVPRNFTATTLQTLDERSYVMVYDGKTRTEVLGQDRVTLTKLVGGRSVTVTLEGYGLAAVSFAAGTGKVSAHLLVPPTLQSPSPLGHAPIPATVQTVTSSAPGFVAGSGGAPVVAAVTRRTVPA